MNLQQKSTNFAQRNCKSRTVLAKEKDRVCDCWAVLTRTEQEFYYETIALLILLGKRVGQSPSRKHRSSTKCKALFSFDWVFFVFVFTSIGTEKGSIFIRGAPFKGGATAVWGGSSPKLPPLDPPLVESVLKAQSRINNGHSRISSILQRNLFIEIK